MAFDVMFNQVLTKYVIMYGISDNFQIIVIKKYPVGLFQINQFDDLMQKRHDSSAFAMELCLFCVKPLSYH